MYTPFEEMSEKSRAWVYILSKNIDMNVARDLENILKNICDEWQSHGQIIKSSYLISYNRFILLFAEDNNSVSGCSIDQSNNKLRKILNQLKIDLQPNSKIGIFNKSKIEFFKKNELINLINNNKIDLFQKMINTTIKNKLSFEKEWVQQIKYSWINKL
jgi:hypothetical protein|tara:strand:- start:13500 stop:13976 length:477 start_codon:yes stop_codon:yes gene_type:complete